MITLIVYGLGNIYAFANIYKRLGIPFAIARESIDLRRASRLLLLGWCF